MARPTTQAKKQRLRHKAILALISSPTIAAAAKKVPCSEESLQNWMRDPDFIQDLSDAQDQAIGHGVIKAQGMFCEAIDVLREIAVDKSVTPSSRIQAANTIITLTTTIIDRRSNAAQIQKLENELKRLRNGEEDEEGASEEESRKTQGKHQHPALADGSERADGGSKVPPG